MFQSRSITTGCVSIKNKERAVTYRLPGSRNGSAKWSKPRTRKKWPIRSTLSPCWKVLAGDPWNQILFSMWKAVRSGVAVYVELRRTSGWPTRWLFALFCCSFPSSSSSSTSIRDENGKISSWGFLLGKEGSSEIKSMWKRRRSLSILRELSLLRAHVRC